MKTSRAHWAILAVLACPACLVPTSQRDAARAEAAKERDARASAENHIRGLEAEIARLRGELARSETQLEEARKAEARTDYDLAVVKRERDDATELVDQLRGELERVADHLRAFGERNKKLAAELGAMHSRVAKLRAQQADADELAKLMADLALALRDDVRAGVVTLSVVGGVPVIGMQPTAAFVGVDTTPAGARALKDVAGVVKPLPGQRLLVAAASRSQEDATRAEQAARALVTAGVPGDRVSLEVPAASATAASPGSGSSVEITVRRVAKPKDDATESPAPVPAGTRVGAACRTAEWMCLQFSAANDALVTYGARQRTVEGGPSLSAAQPSRRASDC